MSTTNRVMTHLATAAVASALGSAAARGQTMAFLDTTLGAGGDTAVVAPGQGFSIFVHVRSPVPLEFNAAQFTVYCTTPGWRVDAYAWSPPFVTGGSGDFSLEGLQLPLVVNHDTLQGPGHPPETPDVEFAVFDLFESATDGQLLRLWVRAPQDAAIGSTFFIGAVPDLFTSGFQVVPVASGTPLRVLVSASASPRDISGDGLVNSVDLAMLLASWGMPSPLGQADGDLDSDGHVDSIDLSYLLAAWTS